MQKLKTVDADTLLCQPLDKPCFVVDGLIPAGLSLFCGSQKIGKSWLMLKLCALNTYLADIDKQAEEMFFRLVEQMKQTQGITERLKEENALEWTGRLNNIRACAREIVEREIIYA